MTDCPNGEMRDLLPDLLHDRLDAPARAAVESHVAGCADCRAELALLGALRGTLRRAPSVDVARIAAAVPAYRAPAAGRPRRWGGLRIAAAITAIAVGGTSIAIARHEPASTAPAVAVVAPTPVPAPTAVAEVPAVAPTVTPGAQLPAPVARVATAKPRRELAVSGAVSDLSDSELASLLGDLQSLDVLPSADVDTSPLVPVNGTSDEEDIL